MKTKLLALAACLMLAGCSPEPDTRLNLVAPERGGRFTVERVGVIADDLAYNNRRGIYIITDTKTGRELVGVSGVGISEVGSHARQHGKTTVRVEDER